MEANQPTKDRRIADPYVIAAREKIDAKCMTMIIGKAEGLKEGAQKTEGSKKNAEAVVSAYPNGQASA